MTELSNWNPVQTELEEKPRKRGLSLGSIVLLLGIVAIAVVFGLQLIRQNQTQPTGGPAPDFTITTFEGDTLKLSDLRGRIVVLNFWASWCAPCRAEAPALQSVWEQYQDDGVVLLGVAYADNGPKSLEYIAEFDITYPNAPDLGTRISETYNIQGVPETFIIDRDGNVAQFIYAGITEAQLSSILDDMLSQG